ncbi:H-type lectin domain-containing protein [Glycomyces sp. YM15]|uniref:H-type lectin domain-containing protein n=1 Tax=Glycomyces sp. YM15 TaxID=2800446 RepID=UPI00196444FE|nr:H-type lectin domain-containing protein [Glycomyces sp. YM15]
MDVQRLADRTSEHDSRFDSHTSRLTALEAFQGTLPNLALQTGKLAVSFSNVSTYTRVITFPRAFTIAPNVFCSLESGAGTTARWGVRPFNITTTGFTLFCYPNDAGSAQTWSNIPVSWLAITLG